MAIKGWLVKARIGGHDASSHPEYFYQMFLDFFSMVPANLWATINGHLIFYLYGSKWVSKYDQGGFTYVYKHFQVDFGVKLWIIEESSWQEMVIEDEYNPNILLLKLNFENILCGGFCGQSTASLFRFFFHPCLGSSSFVSNQVSGSGIWGNFSGQQADHYDGVDRGGGQPDLHWNSCGSSDAG
jgi:hypothetical protein